MSSRHASCFNIGSFIITFWSQCSTDLLLTSWFINLKSIVSLGVALHHLHPTAWIRAHFSWISKLWTHQCNEIWPRNTRRCAWGLFDWRRTKSFFVACSRIMSVLQLSVRPKAASYSLTLPLMMETQVLYIYDYILTLPVEISQIWSSKFTGAKAAFVLCRYGFLIYISLSAIAAYSPITCISVRLSCPS